MSSSGAGNVRSRAMRLLELIRDDTEETAQPVFVDYYAGQMGWTIEQTQAAFKYLTDKRLVDTFSIPYTGRINAHGQDELARQPAPVAATASDAHEWDAFISHASEDKNDLVTPLALALTARGIKVWYDTFTLTVGDSLRRSIDAGLARSRFGVVVLSPDFLGKEWPQRELDGLVAREVSGNKVILPVWHRIDKDGVLRYSPTLADRLAVHSRNGIDAVADELFKAIKSNGATLAAQDGDFRIQVVAPASSGGVTLVANGKTFHRERVNAILAGSGPVELQDQGILILHVIPNEAVSGQSSPKFEVVAREPDNFLPIGSDWLQGTKLTRDGLLVGSNANGLQVPQRAYSFVFRSGAVESVASSILRGQNHSALPLPATQQTITHQTLRLVRALTGTGWAPPFHVHVTLADVAGVRLLQHWPDGAFPEDMPFGTLGNGPIHFDSALLLSVPADRNDCYRMLHPVLAHLANAAGLPAPLPLD